jgi:hypothetical protein
LEKVGKRTHFSRLNHDPHKDLQWLLNKVIKMCSNLSCGDFTEQLNQLTFNDGRDCHGELDTIAKERRR